MGCPPRKIKTARLGVEIEKVLFTQRLKPANKLKLLQIATLAEKKGHVFTVQSFARALGECPNMSLTLVGRDQKGIALQLRQLLAGSAAEKKVSFMDEMDFSRLYDFMKDYHVFIQPSCYTAERDCEGGAPVELLDAQATGMPVISTAHCDIPAEVLHEKTGLLTPEKDIAALAESIRRFYRMGADEYLAFSQAARRHVESRYNILNNARAIREIYQLVLKERGEERK